jgi:hypothetical protein
MIIHPSGSMREWGRHIAAWFDPSKQYFCCESINTDQALTLFFKCDASLFSLLYIVKILWINAQVLSSCEPQTCIHYFGIVFETRWRGKIMLIIVGHTEILDHASAPKACMGRDIFPIIENILNGVNDGLRKPYIDVQIYRVKHADSL